MFKALVPAEILSASAMAATVWPAASLAGNAPLAAGGGAAAVVVVASAMVSGCRVSGVKRVLVNARGDGINGINGATLRLCHETGVRLGAHLSGGLSARPAWVHFNVVDVALAPPDVLRPRAPRKFILLPPTPPKTLAHSNLIPASPNLRLYFSRPFLPCARGSTSPMPRPPASPSPPPASFPFTAGSFDYPHASSSPPSAARSSNRNVLRLADEPPERATSDLHHVAPTAAALRRLSARRRQLHRLLGPPRDSDVADNLLRRPPTANPNRSRATPSERYQAGMGAWRSAFADSPTEPFDSLSEFPIPAMLHAATRSQSPIRNFNAERRQTKRRKLDHDPSRGSGYNSIRYGYKGQIVPGRLKMDIVSCDGGEYKRDNQAGLYNIHNVLKNDKSVYCSESSRCNLLLKHMGDAPFALEKIVIRAPDRGFTAPYVSLLVV